MQNVPKIVADRLRVGTAFADHPDAEWLTAFSERSLPAQERNQVMEHLALCSECRDVVALALPTEESVAQAVRPVRGGLLTWPRLRWGLVAAGVIIAGTFGVVRYRTAQHPVMVAQFESRRVDDVGEQAKVQPAVPPVASEAPKSEESGNAPPKSSGVTARLEPGHGTEFDRVEAFARLQPAPPSDKKTGIGSGGGMGTRAQALPHGPRASIQQWQQNGTLNVNNNAYAFQSQAPPPAVPPQFARDEQSVNGLVVSGQSGAISTGGSAVGGPVDKQKVDSPALNGRTFAELTPLSPAGASAGSEVARAKPAEPAAANAPKPMFDSYGVSEAASNFSPSGSLAPEATRWSINAMGGLQRSADQGKTWQDVDVNAGAEASSGVNLARAMKSSRAKVPASEKERADVKPAPILFRAVAANGADVWAGGSGGFLYHSSDGGGHWARISPSWGGIALTGDILSVQFFDPQHGRLMTSTAEIWTTADGGQTWTKQ